MSSRPAKRARSDTDTHAVDPSQLSELVDSIDASTVANLLIAAARVHPDVASTIQKEVDHIAATERAKVWDFDYLSKSAWKTLNVTYDRLPGSQAYEMAGDAIDSVEECFETIRTHCPNAASFKTKENALETLRKIGKSICLSNGVVGHEVRIHCQSGGGLVPVMLDIAESLADEEMERLRPWCGDKLVELQGIADNYCIFEDLGQVIDLWDGDEEDEEDEDESESSMDGNEESQGETGDETEVEDERRVAGMLP